MFKSPIIPWVVAGFGIVMAILFSIRAERASERAAAAEAQLLTRTLLESQAQEMLSGEFVKFEDSALTYRTSVVVSVDGRAYSDIAEQTSAVDPEVRVVGVPNAEGLDALSRIEPGALFRYRITSVSTGTPVIFSVVVLP